MEFFLSLRSCLIDHMLVDDGVSRGESESVDSILPKIPTPYKRPRGRFAPEYFNACVCSMVGGMFIDHAGRCFGIEFSREYGICRM